MKLHQNPHKPMPFLIFIIPLLLNYVPISAPRPVATDIAMAAASSPFAETPAMSPQSLATAPNPSMKDFKQVWLETHPPVSAPGLEKMEQIKKTCAATDYSSLCQSSVIPLFSSKAVDMSSSVLQLAIKAAAAETNSAISDADSLAISPYTDDETVSSLDDCVSSYQSVLTDFSDAEAAFEKHDKGTMNSMLSAAMSNIRSCTEGFDDPNPVATKNNKLSQMTSNCLAIAESTKG